MSEVDASPGLFSKKASKVNIGKISPLKAVPKKRKTKDTRRQQEDQSPIYETTVAGFRLLVQKLTSGLHESKAFALNDIHPAPKGAQQGTQQEIALQTLSKLAHFENNKPPLAPKENRRLRNLAPPPIQPLPPNNAIGFRPYISPKARAEPEGFQTKQFKEPGSKTPGSINSEVPKFTGISGAYLLSPQYLSPMPNASPKDLFFRSQVDSPGSLAFQELASKAMGTGLGAESSTQDTKSIPSAAALPSPHLYPMSIGGYGVIFPVVGVGPHLSFNLAHVQRPPHTSETAAFPEED